MEFLKKLLAILNPNNIDGAKSKAMNVVYAVTALVVAIKEAWAFVAPLIGAGQ